VVVGGSLEKFFFFDDDTELLRTVDREELHPSFDSID